jgi:hypothetical protein
MQLLVIRFFLLMVVLVVFAIYDGRTKTVMVVRADMGRQQKDHWRKPKSPVKKPAEEERVMNNKPAAAAQGQPSPSTTVDKFTDFAYCPRKRVWSMMDNICNCNC